MNLIVPILNTSKLLCTGDDIDKELKSYYKSRIRITEVLTTCTACGGIGLVTYEERAGQYKRVQWTVHTDEIKNPPFILPTY